MSRIHRIQTLLTAEFAPIHLEVVDESAAHEGHAGWRQGEVTHIAVRINASQLHAMSRLQAHRAIHTALAGEWESGLHALRIILV